MTNIHSYLFISYVIWVCLWHHYILSLNNPNVKQIYIFLTGAIFFTLWTSFTSVCLQVCTQLKNDPHECSVLFGRNKCHLSMFKLGFVFAADL